MRLKVRFISTLMLVASPFAAHAGPRLPSPDLNEVSGHPDQFSGHLLQLCTSSPASDGRRSSWPLEIHGSRPFADHVCLVGRIEVNTSPRSDQFQDLAGWVFEVDENLQRQVDASTCLEPEVVQGATIVSYFTDNSNSGRSSQFGFEGDAESARLVSIGTDEAGPPLIAVLSASRATIWDFVGIPSSRLKAVILVGSKDQAAARLPHETKLRFLTPMASDAACGSPPRIRPASSASENLASLAREALHANVRPIDDLDPVAINLDGGRPPRPEAGDILPTALQTARPIVHDTVPPGIAGLTKLFQQGAIRNATQADVDAWLHARGKSGLNEITLGSSGLYVVTRAVTIPRDMFGSNLAKFLILDGVPLPVDHGSHNSYFTIADGLCKGTVSCR